MDANTGFNNFNSEIETRVPAISYHEIIRQLNAAVIPRVTAIANMGWCERAAYDISFFGVEGFPENNMGDVIVYPLQLTEKYLLVLRYWL